MNATANTSTVTSPPLKDYDVVCGRGGLANKHPGNILLRRICSENKNLYQATMNPTHKQCLILSIIMAIRQNGGRFVSRAKTGWEEIEDKKAKEKTAQLLRESEAPIHCNKPKLPVSRDPVVKKGIYRQRRQQMFDRNSNRDYLMQMTPEVPSLKEPMLIPPEPLPTNAQYTADPIPSDDLAEFLMEALPLREPLPVAPRAPHVRPFDDGDLFDLIPLDAAHDDMENNPEFQNLCVGLVSALS